MVVNYVKMGIMDKRKLELGGLTGPIEMLVKRGMDNNMSSEQMAVEIAKAISGTAINYPSGKLSILTAPARMLVTLVQEPTMTQRALSIYLGISEAAVQKTIKSLASTGLVAKTKVKGRNHYSVNVSQFLELPDIAILSRIIGIAQEVPF